MMRSGRIDDSFMGPAVHTEGEAFVNDAWEADSKAKRQRLARKGLDRDLDNIDAYVLLGLDASTLGERLALFREAVRVGDVLWAPYLDDPEMAWWGFMGTRPYMRALQNLGIALMEAGDLGEAEEVLTRLLTLNPNDNQGVRAQLIWLWMAWPRVGRLRDLVKRYPEDMLLETVMAQLWLDLRSAKADIAARCAKVAERNPHVLPKLVAGDRTADDQSPYGLTLGGADEAADYVDRFGPIWLDNAQAMTGIRGCLAAARPG